MKRKFAFIGAGFLDFARGPIRDILTLDAFKDYEIMLMDINKARLKYAKDGTMRIVEVGEYPAVAHATIDRKEALKDANGVLTTTLQGGVGVWRHDIEIPKKYGVDIYVGDTRGPSGIFQFLRTAPILLDVIRDVGVLCPNAIVLNYTNPMAVLVSYLQTRTEVNVTGLCHSVQGTTEMLANWIGVDPKEISYTYVGIDHQAFYLNYEWKGKDAYPLIQNAIQRGEVANEEMVRIEMYRHLGYLPAESNGHNSEYNPWFRKRKDLIETYCTHGAGRNPGTYAYILDEYLEREDTWGQEYRDWMDQGDIGLEWEDEYASNIFNAIFGDHTPYFFSGNLRNKGHIRNVVKNACVEVPVIATSRGIHSIQQITLPDHLALMVDHSARIEELAVQGALNGDPQLIFEAILFDSLAASVLSMQEIHDMVQEMLHKNKDYLTYFKTLDLKD